jgi:hypothetical protein
MASEAFLGLNPAGFVSIIVLSVIERREEKSQSPPVALVKHTIKIYSKFTFYGVRGAAFERNLIRY